ncbi:hypothetical protein [Jannaschia seohaensis]|uniref:SnoaL-like domain-containing protein n=1 Tax=Jannaschia seohaensis TaxID=475081 RepID=A0A2Y9C0C7_9RHOB|nr:hypothetical protein [Jannaschia seohaensis]PWJ19290.1 hypothetical protein BCF38_104224 [Jannaschia seohaensis]SSA45952.1 hypothetical protein SAMN05421539_104224 [Jannaschia seohaensis]
MTDAVAIYQNYLDTVCDLLWRGQYEEICEHMVFPNAIIMLDAMAEDISREQMLENLKSLHDSLLRQGAQSFYRLCQTAQVDPLDPSRILGTHRSYVLRGGTYVVPPYDNRLLLVQTEGRWRAAKLQTLARNSTIAGLSPAGRWKVPVDGGNPSHFEGTKK